MKGERMLQLYVAYNTKQQTMKRYNNILSTYHLREF